jgi:mRNA interferase MazF
MDGLVAGDVVLVNFPFSDHERGKDRPALILGRTVYGGYLVGYISSRKKHLEYAVEVNASDLVEGGLSKTSYIRAEISYVVGPGFVQEKLARVSREVHERVLQSLNAYLRSEYDYRIEQEEA